MGLEGQLAHYPLIKYGAFGAIIYCTTTTLWTWVTERPHSDTTTL